MECLIVLLLLAGGVWLVDERFGSDAKALRILKQMSLKYSQCQSMRDRIEMTVEDKETGKQPKAAHYIINVEFQAPASLRYEVNENMNGNLKLVSLACAHNKKGTISLGGLDSPVVKETEWVMDIYGNREGQAYGALDAPSRWGTGDLLTVPEPFGLVMPGYDALRYSDFDDVRIRGTEFIESHECYLLESRHWETLLWIDKATLVLRKVVEGVETKVDSRHSVLLFHPEFKIPTQVSLFHLSASQMAVAQQKP